MKNKTISIRLYWIYSKGLVAYAVFTKKKWTINETKNFLQNFPLAFNTYSRAFITGRSTFETWKI